MKKKAKTLEVKLRSALRLIWSRSAERRVILKDAIYKVHIDDTHPPEIVFDCPICKKTWPSQMAEVDHIEPLGTLDRARLTEWVDDLFNSPQRVLCKICHRRKTSEQRKKKK